jgi:LysR family glycine cleavage system transcriptional activator
MARRLPPLNSLRAFEAAARLGSFKAAADEALVTHGAISRQIKLLEGWLGTQLFERRNRRAVLTDAGAAYLADVASAMDRIAVATDRCRLHRGHRRLRVNVITTFTVRWLLPRLVRFHDANPEIDIDVVTSNADIESMQEPFDVAIRTGPDPVDGYQVSGFLAERRLPVCSPNLLARIPLKQPKDLQQHTLLHCATRPRFWSHWLSSVGLADLKPAGNVTLEHYYLALEGALGGMGVALGPVALIERDIAEKRFAVPFPELWIPGRSYCTYIPVHLARDPAVRTFKDWLGVEGTLAEASLKGSATKIHTPLQDTAALPRPTRSGHPADML